MFLQVNTPVPKDIPLPLPLPEPLLIFLLIISFLAHIIFINLMVGGSFVTLWAQIKGLKDRKYDVFAHEIAKTITVNKSIAVVLGVAPLLSINTLYTVYFYSANALTGFAWIMIIPLVTVAFLLTYLHKYTWDALEHSKKLHISIMGLAVGVFLFIPLVFLTNVNLMMFPEKWGTVQGFVSALMLPNVFPRYLEFLGACLGITGIFIVWYNNRKNYDVEDIYEGKFSRYEIKKLGYTIAIAGLGLQILFGALVLVTLPSKGIGADVIAMMGAAGLLLVLALWLSYQSIQGEPEKIDVHFKKITLSIFFFMLFYGGSRQVYRHNSLEKHQELMAAHTADFQRLSKEARENQALSQPVADLEPALKGEKIFKTNCAACHKKEGRLVGPPVAEMVEIYDGKARDLKSWIKSPGKKRADMPQMPGFPQLSEEELEQVSNYILSIR